MTVVFSGEFLNLRSQTHKSHIRGSNSQNSQSVLEHSSVHVMVYECSVCPKTFTRRFNMSRHMENIHPHRVDDDRESVLSVETETGDDIDMVPSDESENSSEESGAEDSDEEEDEEEDGEAVQFDIWNYLKEKVVRAVAKERYETPGEVEDEMMEDEGKAMIKIEMMPTVREGIMKAYTTTLMLWHYAKRDPVNKKVKETKRKLIEDEDYEPDEAIRHAVKKRRYLTQKATGVHEEDDLGWDDSEVEQSTEDYVD